MRTANAAHLPALPSVSTGNPALDRWIQAVSERLEVREGNRGNPNERAVTVRELVGVGFKAFGMGPRAAATDAGGVLTVLSDGSYGAMSPDAFSESIRSSRLYKDMMKRLDDVTRFDRLPEKVRLLLLVSLAEEAAKREADIRRVELKLQSESESLAYTVQEVTAGLQGALAGVREMAFASATPDTATAGIVTQLLAALDGTGSATAEESLVVIADRTAGLSSQYMLKLNAGKAVTAVGLMASEDPLGNTESMFVVQADQFALTGTYTYMAGDMSSVPPVAEPSAATDGETWYNTRTNLSYRAAGGIWVLYTQPIPFGVDMTTNTTYINGQLRIGSAGGVALDDVVAGATGTSTAIVYAYKRSATDLIAGWDAATTGPGAVTWTFATGSITTPATDTLSNGWTKTIPAGANPLYVSVCTAANTTATDDVAATEWATPSLLVQNGPAGSDGLSVGTAILYQRNASSTIGPAAQANTVTFTFATGVMTGMSAGWTAAIPDASTGAFLWVTRATAASATGSDDLLASEWSAPVLYTQDGLDGTSGVDGHSVSLDTAAVSQVISYDPAGNRISEGNGYIYVYATPYGCSGTPYYTFYQDNVEVQASSTDSSYTYTKQALYTSMPDVIRVELRDGSGTGPVVASDQMSFVGVKMGSNGLSVSLTNDAHTLPTTTAGVVTYTGSGTAFQVFDGATELTCSANSASYPATAGQYNVTASGSGITIGAISTAGKSLADATGGMSGTTASVTINFYIKKLDGTTLLVPRKQSHAKSLQGATGQTGGTGGTGATGTRGTIVTKITGVWNATSAAAAVSAIATAAGATPTTPIKGDICYYTGGAKECTAAGNPGTWGAVAAYIDGSLVVTGTISGDKISGGTITSVGINTGRTIIASGASWTLGDSAYLAAGVFNTTYAANNGCYGQTNNAAGAGVKGFASTSGAYGVSGIASSASGGVGVYAMHQSSSGYGLQVVGKSTFNKTIESTVTTGTAPFSVLSTTTCPGLSATNAEQLGGVAATTYLKNGGSTAVNPGTAFTHTLYITAGGITVRVPCFYP